jgi:GTP:adenosylcobinamide-phosphate guanylyltransferase
MRNPQLPFTAVVLAADRGPSDPVAEAAGVNCKSMAPVGGTPMVFRVLDALAASKAIATRIICGPPKSIVDSDPGLDSLIASGELKWFENQATPSASAFHVLQTLPDEAPVLLTTADHALLSTRIIDFFTAEALASDCDIVAGVARHEVVTEAYPQTRRTATRLRDGAYCGCNLFAFLTARSRRAADFWRRVEAQRKKPLRVIRVLGWITVLRYLMGILSLNEALVRMSRRLGFKAGAVILPFPEAAVDVDSVCDWKLVEEIVSGKCPD